MNENKFYSGFSVFHGTGFENEYSWGNRDLLFRMNDKSCFSDGLGNGICDMDGVALQNDC